jgi:hypothetical protein
VLGAFAVALGVLFGSSLCGGQVLLPLDNLRGEVPFRLLPPTRPHGNLLQGDLIELVVPSLDAARRGLTAGRWPLWNSRVGAGMPLLADPQAQALAPLAILALPFSPLRGAAVIAALRVLLALVFTFLLLRRQGLGVGPSLAGALAFGLSGITLLWVGWPLASSAALLPAVLYALARLAGGGRWRRDALLLAVALAALLLAGHPETELYACLLAAAFAAGLVRWWRWAWRRRRCCRLSTTCPRPCAPSASPTRRRRRTLRPPRLPRPPLPPRPQGPQGPQRPQQRQRPRALGAARSPGDGCRSWRPTPTATAALPPIGGPRTATRMPRGSPAPRRLSARRWRSRCRAGAGCRRRA